MSLMAACGDDDGDGTDAVADAGDDTSPPVDPDMIDASCTLADFAPPACTDPTITNIAATSQAHIVQPEAISYTTSPPSSGPHRPAWAKWGEYDFLPPQRWLHNLEHGGVALLYHPCVDASVVDELRAVAAAQADDDTGAFRYTLTPYADLPTAVAVVAWEWSYEAECVDAAAIKTFIDDHYRQAPEDFAQDGSYSTGWLSR